MGDAAQTLAGFLTRLTATRKRRYLIMIASVALVHYSTNFSSSSTGGRSKRAGAELVPAGKRAEKKKRPSVDKEFLDSLRWILKILIPSVVSKEAAYVASVAFLLVARTWCDLWILENGTSIERAIIARDGGGFARHFGEFLAAMAPFAFVNNALKYSLGELRILFRSRLTAYFTAAYMRRYTYYQITNLDGRISNVDQLLCEDVHKFCSSIVEVYSNCSKPLLDIGIYLRELSRTVGPDGPAAMFSYMVAVGIFVTRLRRPVAAQTVEEAQLEGHFRHVHTRLGAAAEEVAFYGGGPREHLTLKQQLAELSAAQGRFLRFRTLVGVVDYMVAKYLAKGVGYLSLFVPFMAAAAASGANVSLEGGAAVKSVDESLSNMQAYYRSGRMLVNLGEAMGRLVLSGRELTRLAGLTARMRDLKAVLDDLNAGVYSRTAVGQPGQHAKFRVLEGVLVYQDHIIKFDNVPIVTPPGEVLIQELSFEVHPGQNVLVSGPNGCGKSSLFRILGELWPLKGGVLTKPTADKLFYIPQRPYLPLGSLRDQVAYPYDVAMMKAKGRTDQEIIDVLRVVQLEKVAARDPRGLDAVCDWHDVLSGGEKQRIAMARLFFHKPQFAILDECTSAVSVDVEDILYSHSRAVGITLFTVSHRRTLWKHHQHILEMEGGSEITARRKLWRFRPMTKEDIDLAEGLSRGAASTDPRRTAAAGAAAHSDATSK